jgi:hypothetical protein
MVESSSAGPPTRGSGMTAGAIHIHAIGHRLPAMMVAFRRHGLGPHEPETASSAPALSPSRGDLVRKSLDQQLIGWERAVATGYDRRLVWANGPFFSCSPQVGLKASARTRKEPMSSGA